MEKLPKPVYEKPIGEKVVKVYVGDDKFSNELHKAIWKDPERFAGQHLIIIKPELFSTILSNERLRLLKALEKNPKNMGELAKMLDRPREAVSRDFKKLQFHGLVDFEMNGKEKVPSRPAEISVSI